MRGINAGVVRHSEEVVKELLIELWWPYAVLTFSSVPLAALQPFP